jgi:polyisoprenoid-binding protein YceI
MNLKYSLILLAVACTGKPGETVTTKEATAVETVSSTETKEYTLDSATSELKWEGYEGLQLLNSEHYGTIAIQSGKLLANGNALTGGLFTIDMNTITVLDIPVEKAGNAKLTRHLKNEDFFDTAKFPEARFEIASVSSIGADSAQVTGNLTIKEIARSIQFPAKISVSESTITASARFFINRLDWGVVYRSQESLGNKMIRPEIGFHINLTARR